MQYAQNAFVYYVTKKSIINNIICVIHKRPFIHGNISDDFIFIGDIKYSG